MEKDQKLLGKLTAGTEINSSEPFGHVLQGRRAKPGSSQDSAQWINVATIGNPSEQRGFERGRAAAHERVVNDVARLGKAFDKEARYLRLETSAVRDLVEGMDLTLSSSPEFVDEGWDFRGFAISAGEAGGQFSGRLAKLTEGNQLGH